MKKTICIIQTGTASSKELTELCAEIMPDARTFQIIDDSILQEVLAVGKLTPSVNRRMYAYCQQAREMGADAILHHCVAAAGVVEMIRPFLDIPIVRIDEGMALQAVRTAERIALFATAPLALEQSMRLMERLGEQESRRITLTPVLLKNAKETVRAAAEKACEDHDVIVLAQPGMTALLPLLERLDKPVLSCTRSGIEHLKKQLERS